jgi:hypothetical protein
LVKAHPRMFVGQLILRPAGGLLRDGINHPVQDRGHVIADGSQVEVRCRWKCSDDALPLGQHPVAVAPEEVHESSSLSARAFRHLRCTLQQKIRKRLPIHVCELQRSIRAHKEGSQDEQRETRSQGRPSG